MGNTVFRACMQSPYRLVSDPEKNKDPVAFVEALLALKVKLDAVVAKAFNADRNFQNAVNHAFESFMNTNQRWGAVQAAKLDPGFESTPVSKFDCEYRIIHSAFKP